MEIKRILKVDATNAKQVAEAFVDVEPRKIELCNWHRDYPYTPKVEFRVFHTGECLLLRFDVEEHYTQALAEDNGKIWCDSCVEFFIALDDKGFYNLEANCIGRILLGYRKSRNEGIEHASQESLNTILRTPTIAQEPFSEIKGDNRWSLTLALPAEALFKHNLTTWSGVQAKCNLYKCGDELSEPHFLSWQPIDAPKPDFHRPDSFAEVRFSK